MREKYESEKSVAEFAMHLASITAYARSKDPKTKVGACAYDWETGATYLGYNGFPPGFPDNIEYWNEKEGALFQKHELCIHAESNAMRKALISKANMTKIELFITHAPCLRCAVEHIAVNKISAVTFNPVGPGMRDLWRVKLVLAEAGIPIYYYEQRLKSSV